MHADKGCVVGFVCWSSKVAIPDAENAEFQSPTEQVRTLGFNLMHGTLSQRAELWTRLKSSSTFTLALAPLTPASCRSFPCKLDPMSLQIRRTARRGCGTCICVANRLHVQLSQLLVNARPSAQYMHRAAAEGSRSGIPVDRIFTSAC